jgi:hypothetical protein
MNNDKSQEKQAFALGSLIGLEDPQKVAKVLDEVYGVRDANVAERYVAEGASLGLSTDQLIRAMLTIAPLAAHGRDDRSDFVGVEEQEVLRDILKRVDPIRFQAIKARFNEFETGEREFDHLPGAGWRNLVVKPNDRVDWSRYFIGEGINTPGTKMMSSAKSSECHVIVADHPEIGPLVGPGVVFEGIKADDGLLSFKTGWVLYGPRINLVPDFYILDVDVEIRDDGELLLDIVSRYGLRKLFEINLIGYARFRHKFEVKSEDHKLEVRIVNKLGRPVEAKLTKILVTRNVTAPFMC